LVVVCGNVGNILVFEIAVHADDGNAAVVQFLDALPVLTARHDEQTFDVARLHLQQFLIFDVGAFIAVADDGNVSAVADFGVDFAGNVGEERVAQGGDDQGDGVAFAG